NLWGIPGAPVTYTYANSATGPFAFTFDVTGHLLVVEAGDNAVSSFDVLPNSILKIISLSVPNGQAAACWIAGTPWGNVFTANPGIPSISAYRDMLPSGKITLVDSGMA